MRSERARGGLAALVAVTLLLVGGARLFADSNPAIRLIWALLIRAGDGSAKTVDCSRDVVRLKSNDRIRIFLRPQTACYFYLYLHDAQKNLFLLFPDQLSLWDKPADVEKSYTLPGSDRWFHLDERSGTEVIYLILSNRRLRALEAMTGRDWEKGVGRSGLHSIPYSYDVLEEIRRIIAACVSANVVEKPVPVAGDFRGLQDEGELDGISVEARGVYVRTIRIEH